MLIGVLQMNMVAAATSQGLSWGFQVNDQFNFQLKIQSPDEIIDEGIYMKVTTRPDIPNIITDWSQIPQVDIDIAYDNGTSLGWYLLIYLFLYVYLGSLFAVPVGNFSLIQALHTAQDLENITYINTYYYWGMKFTGQVGGHQASCQATYLKSDGFLAKYTVKTWNATTTLVESSTIRDGLPSDTQDLIMSNILYIGAGVVVLIIIGAVVCKKR